jgi:hypothetical protein
MILQVVLAIVSMSVLLIGYDFAAWKRNGKPQKLPWKVMTGGRMSHIST